MNFHPLFNGQGNGRVIQLGPLLVADCGTCVSVIKSNINNNLEYINMCVYENDILLLKYYKYGN